MLCFTILCAAAVVLLIFFATIYLSISLEYKNHLAGRLTVSIRGFWKKQYSSPHDTGNFFNKARQANPVSFSAKIEQAFIPELYTKANLRLGCTFMRKTLRTVHVDKLKISVSAGLSDPADTGKLFSAIQAFKYNFLVIFPHLELYFQPIFTDEALELAAEGTVHVNICELLWVLLVLLLSPDSLKFLWLIIKKIHQQKITKTDNKPLSAVN